MIRVLKSKFLKFGLSGVFNTFVDWSIYFLLKKALVADPGSLEESVARVGGILAGITSAYIINSLWVFYESFATHFKERTTSRSSIILKGYIKSCLSYAVGMSLNFFIFMILRKVRFMEGVAIAIVTNLSLPPERVSTIMEVIALLTATVFSMLFNFSALKKFVFKPKVA